MNSLYNTPEFPHKGWKYEYEQDLGELCGECEICGTPIRYSHHIFHPQYGSLVVGVNCCEKLLEPYAYQYAKEKDSEMKKNKNKRRCNMAQIKKFKDFDTTQGYSDGIKQLPKGGYVLKILNAEVCENSNGQYIKVSCDVAEGDYADFFMIDWKSQDSEDKKWHCNYLLNVPKDDGSEKDGWTKRKFKTFTNALEDSNEGYHFDWDSDKFKGKLIGGLFNIREYEYNGKRGKTTNLAQVTAVAKIRNNDYKLPDDKYLSAPAQNATGNEPFMQVNEEETPF